MREATQTKLEKMADNVVAQIQQGVIPNVHKAMREHSVVSLAPKTAANFHRVLFQSLPYEVVVDKQMKVSNAWSLKKMTFDINDDVDAICEKHDLKLVAKRSKGNTITAWVKIPNWEYIDKSLDKIYKIFGIYAAEKHEISQPLEEMTDEELQRIVAGAIKIDKPQEKAIIEVQPESIN